jgi:hypothetical protein
MKDTNITCPVDSSTHEYSCENIAGNQEYIVRYIKNLGDGKVFEMKTNVSVADEDVAGEKITKITTLIASAISDAVEEGLSSVSSVDAETVKELMKSIKESITKSVVTLITKGIIQLPSDNDMTITLEDGKTFDDFTKTVEDNKELSKDSGTILSDKSVVNALDASKNSVKLENYANLEKVDLVKEIFRESGDKGIPNWIAKFLADKYDTKQEVVAFSKKIIFSKNDGKWLYNDLKRMGIELDSNDIEDIIKVINKDISDGKLLSSFKASLAKYKSAKDSNDVDTLASFPPIIGYLFPDGTLGEKFENVGQALVYIMYAEDIFAPAIQKREFETVMGDSGFGDKLENMHIIEFEPDFILEDLGLTPTLIAQKYDTPEVNHFEVRTGSDWTEKGQIEFMTFDADFSKASWMMGENKFDSEKLTKITLTYPTTTSSKSITLSADDLNIDSWGDEFHINYGPWKNNCQDGNCKKEDFNYIKDNISGDYTITAIYNGETFTDTFNQFILKGATKYVPTLTSPIAQPRWPEELNGQDVNWDSLTTLQDTALKEFRTKESDFMKQTGGNGYVTFATNTDTDSDDKNDSVNNLIVSWDDSSLKDELSKLDIPENIVPAYQVGVSLYEPDTNGDGKVTEDERRSCEREWDSCNTEIFNTWWSNRPIKTTSIQLPVTLKENSGDGRYQLHVDLVFIDKTTGQEVAHGGNSFAEFKVGTVAELSGKEAIVFNGKVIGEGNSMSKTMKVAFTRDECTFDAKTYEQSCTSEVLDVATPKADGSYTLSVNAKEIKGSADRAGYNIVAFDDLDKDGKWDQWRPEATEEENQNSEPAWWLDSKWFNFENWGEFRVNVDSFDGQTNENRHESYRIEADKNVVIDGMNISLYGFIQDPDNAAKDGIFYTKFSLDMLEGKKFYFVTKTVDGEKFADEAEFNADGSRSYSRDGENFPEAKYEITDNGNLHIFNNDLNVTAVIVGDGYDEGAILSLELLDKDGKKFADRLVFDTKEDRDQFLNDKTLRNDSPLVGTWIAPSEDAPFDTMVVVFDNKHYFMTQQRLGEDGAIGGVEVGEFTLSEDGKVATDERPVINTNDEDSAVGAKIEFVDIDKMKIDELEFALLKATEEHPEAGTWITPVDDGFSLLVLDGSNYMYSDIDLDVNSMGLNSDDGRNNATEFGTYTIDEDGNFKATPAEKTDFDNAKVGDVAGDSNGDYGFNELKDIKVSFSDDENIMSVEFKDGNHSETHKLIRIIQNGPVL